MVCASEVEREVAEEELAVKEAICAGERMGSDGCTAARYVARSASRTCGGGRSAGVGVGARLAGRWLGKPRPVIVGDRGRGRDAKVGVGDASAAVRQ